MRFGIIANMDRPDAERVVGRIIEWAGLHGVTLHFCDLLKARVGRGQSFMPREKLPENTDVIVSLGGDGTMLSTARAVGAHGTPILGINLGYLGFLTQLTPAALEVTLDSILDHRYQIEERMVALVMVENGARLTYPCALNDVVVDRGQVSRIIHLDLYANDSFICSYAADGLIISTPTGSTAYSLAAGGPIVNPRLSVFVATPISPFSLTTRPILFSENDILRVMTRSKHSEPVLTLDGQVACNLDKESSFTVRKADYCIKIVVLHKDSFYEVLRSKLHWGRLPEGA
jgi:NAD+ kinase